MRNVTRFLKENDTFWNGKESERSDKLNELIPAMGEVKNKGKNKALEDFRKLQNAYYRFYNDGDNYGRKLRLMFGRYGLSYDYDGGDPRKLEELADAVFAAALEEQGIS